LIGWLTTYQRAWLRDDLVSGVVVGMIMIPVAMAYAQMAGVPPQQGLYSAIIGMAVYAVFATSRHLKITTSSECAPKFCAASCPAIKIAPRGRAADLDIGTAEMLRDLYSDLRANQIDLLFAQIRGSVRDRMQKTGLLEHLREEHLYASTAAAVAAFQAQPVPAEVTAAAPPEST
jgi:MFS superfamily sulfate permease-like transporter